MTIFDGLFVFIYVSYLLLAIHVEKWTALSTLANKSATPDFFVRYPELLLITNAVLFLASIAASFFTVYISKYVSIPLVFITFLGVVSIGRRMAHKRHNEVLGTNVTYQEFHRKLIDNKRVIKKRKLRMAVPSSDN